MLCALTKRWHTNAGIEHGKQYFLLKIKKSLVDMENDHLNIYIQCMFSTKTVYRFKVYISFQLHDTHVGP